MRLALVASLVAAYGCYESTAAYVSDAYVPRRVPAEDDAGAAADDAIAQPDQQVAQPSDTFPASTPDTGFVFPAVCLFKGTPCTGSQDDVDCFPRQDPVPAVWDWYDQEAEAKIVNCWTSPFSFIAPSGSARIGPTKNTTITVTRLPAKSGQDCIDGGPVKPATACYFRAHFEVTCKPDAGTCIFELPTWQQTYTVGASVGTPPPGPEFTVFFGPPK